MLKELGSFYEEIMKSLGIPIFSKNTVWKNKKGTL